MDSLIPKRHCCKREQTRSLQPLQARTGLQHRMGCTGWHVSPEMMGPSGAVAPGGRAQHPLPAAGEGGTASRPPSPAGRGKELLQAELAGQKAKSMGWEPQNPGETGAPKAALEGEGAVPLQSSWYLWPLWCPHGAVPVTGYKSSSTGADTSVLGKRGGKQSPVLPPILMHPSGDQSRHGVTFSWATNQHEEVTTWPGDNCGVREQHWLCQQESLGRRGCVLSISTRTGHSSPCPAPSSIPLSHPHSCVSLLTC